MSQAVMCSECLWEKGRTEMLQQKVEPVIVIVAGESLCLDHAEEAQVEARA